MSSSREISITIDSPLVETAEGAMEGVSQADSINGKVGVVDEGASLLPIAATPNLEAGKGDGANKATAGLARVSSREFRDKLVENLSSKIGPGRLDQFMAKADEYPRFVWQDLVLSFQFFCADKQDLKEDTFGPHALQKLFHIIESYPDILQRQLLTDGLLLNIKIAERKKTLEEEIQKEKKRLMALQNPPRQKTGEIEKAPLTPPGPKIGEIEQAPLTPPGPKGGEIEKQGEEQDNWELETEICGHGVLHAAVLLNQTELVRLVSNLDHIYGEKIFSILTEKLVSLNSFFQIRRAVAWTHMQKLSGPVVNVDLFMKKFPKGSNASDRKALETLIWNLRPQQIDLTDEYIPDPWVVILAWSSISKGSRHIIEQFKELQPQLFDKIVTTLRNRGSPFTKFFTSGKRGRTVENILESLLKRSRGKRLPRNFNRPNKHLMQRFFLDRLCERTPKSHWSPLHLAAARGDLGMLKLFVESCDKILSHLEDETAQIYTRKLQDSFCDAKAMTPLHYAVLSTHKDAVECVKSLAQWKIFQPYVNKRDIFMRTAFQIACSRQQRAPMVEQFIKCEKVDVDVNTKDCCMFTPLHWAVYSLSSEAVQFLVYGGDKRMIRTTERDKEGRHPYDMAARFETLPGKETTKYIGHLLLGSNSVKDEVDSYYRDRQVYVDASNAILVGAALIASVTFGGWLQPPLGDHLGSTNRKVRVFWAFNTLSFFFAIATVMAGATAVVPISNQYIKDSVEGIRRWLVITSFLLILSVSCVLGAFAAGGFASLSVVPDLTENMTISTSIGSFFCTIIGVVSCYRLVKVHAVWRRMFKEELESFNELHRKLEASDLTQSFRQIIHQSPIYPSVITEKVASDTDAGPKENPSLQSVMLAVPTIMRLTREKKIRESSYLPDDSLPPTGVEYFILEEWEKIHQQKDGSNICPIRECYQQVEGFCLREILNYNGTGTEELNEFIKMRVTESSPKEYSEMWRELSQNELFKGTANQLVKPKATSMTN